MNKNWGSRSSAICGRSFRRSTSSTSKKRSSAPRTSFGGHMTRRDLQTLPANSRAENYLVALIGEANLRLFAVSGGAVEEVVEITPFDNRQVRHLRTVGTDHLGQSSNLQS